MRLKLLVATAAAMFSLVLAPVVQAHIYWGAGIGSQFTGSNAPWDWNAVTDFQNTDAGGKNLSVVTSGSPFHSSAWCGGACNFPASLYSTVRSHGVIPLMSWSSQSTDSSTGYTDAQIAAGSQDAYITQYAREVKAWGHPFFLRFDWEMNGDWYPWSVGANTAASYVAMWRHVHNIFTSVGATNASWVWCPNINFPPLSGLYPGSSYVDWTCLDAYNGDIPWTSFYNLIHSTYYAIANLAPYKPMMVGETASTETGGSKSQWITSLLHDVPAYFPKIRALLWYDVYGVGPGGYSDWPIESSSSSKYAFAKGIASSWYVPNWYSNLNTSPIPAP